MKPYFSIGEEVILVSKEVPECNGEYTVECIKNTLADNDYNYRLEGLRPSLVCKTFRPTDYFAQSALRKKHKPSDESFTNMINTLNKESIHE